MLRERGEVGERLNSKRLQHGVARERAERPDATVWHGNRQIAAACIQAAVRGEHVTAQARWLGSDVATRRSA